MRKFWVKNLVGRNQHEELHGLTEVLHGDHVFHHYCSLRGWLENIFLLHNNHNRSDVSATAADSYLSTNRGAKAINRSTPRKSLYATSGLYGHGMRSGRATEVRVCATFISENRGRVTSLVEGRVGRLRLWCRS